jgi:hypothetical protein
VNRLKLSTYKTIIFLFSILLLDSILASAQTKQPLRQKLNLVFQRLDFARELQASFNNRSINETLNKAELKLKQARELIQSRRRFLANQSINEAEILINQAMRELLKEPVRKRRESLTNKIQIATELVRKSDNQEANDILDRGIENKNIAEQAFRSGEFQKAIRHFRQAEFQIQKSIDIASNRDKSTATQASEEAQQFNQLIIQSESIISKSSDPEVQKNYRLAIKLSQRAEKASLRGNFSGAIDLYHQATRLLLRTRDLAEGKTDRSAIRAYEEVATLDELIENIQQRVQSFEDDERVQFFMSHLEQLQEDAHQALDAQDYKLVLLNTQYARDLIERIQKKLRGGNNEIADLIDQELKQLEVDLNDINDRLVVQGTNEEATILLTYARFARVKAKELLDEQNYRIARESILVASRFAFAADRLIRKQNTEDISSETILAKILTVEKEISSFQSKITAATRPDAGAYLDQAKKMLDLARENLNKNYRYTANVCIEASQSAIEKLRAVL